jgi:hypothetical protein
MGIITMNMSNDPIERDSAPEYGEEVLQAGWIPALALREREVERLPMPVDLLSVDAEAFLRAMYVLQR